MQGAAGRVFLTRLSGGSISGTGRERCFFFALSRHDMEWEIEIFKKSLLDLVISFLYENDVECVSLMRLPLHKTDIPVPANVPYPT